MRKLKWNINAIEGISKTLFRLASVQQWVVGVRLVWSIRQMAWLNWKTRGKLKSTDVLSFRYDTFSANVIDEPARPLGEIVLCMPLIEKRSSIYGEKLWHAAARRLLIRLLVHGLCHIKGYDHVYYSDYKKVLISEQIQFICRWPEQKLKFIDHSITRAVNID